MLETTRNQATELLVAGNPSGDGELLSALMDRAGELEPDALALIGDLSGPDGASGSSFRLVLESVGGSDAPVFFVPGRGDAPLSSYLREAANMEVVHPRLRGVHGTFGFAPGRVMFAGMGGWIVDDPDAVRNERGPELSYPAWEVEYRLKALSELKEYQRVFLFATRPAHRSLEGVGSEELAELVKTHDPGLVLVPGSAGTRVELGSSQVVCAGDLTRGEFVTVDMLEDEVEIRNLEGATV